MGALDDVIATPELLEAILLQLDPHTLLLAVPRVSRYVGDVVARSPALQRKLFFVAVDDDDDDDDGSEAAAAAAAVLTNPLLERSFFLWGRATTPTRTGRRCGGGGGLPATAGAGATAIRHRGYSVHSFRDMGVWRDEARTAALMRRGASWRRMQVQRPAVRALPVLSRGFEFRAAEGAVRAVALGGTTRFPSGLTMGELYDMTQQRIGVAAEYAAYFFRILRRSDFDEEDASEEEQEGQEGQQQQQEEEEEERVRPDVRPLLERHGIVYEEHGYYPSRVLGRDLEDKDSPWDQLYRHPEFRHVEVHVEKMPD
ncbi:hypothetical protein GGR56DRAFT_686077 [Xylariaceae sp. FL0804]|nr:hypothetical protein GGR56DRAFT_686077 [Xylariaceae sp. FL0804]